MVDPVNKSNVSGADYAKRTAGTGSVDNSDRPSQPNDQTVTTSPRPSGAGGQTDPFLDDFDADESAIGRGLFAAEALNPDSHTQLILTVRLTIHETVRDLADNDEDMRVAAERHMRKDSDDRVESIHAKAKQAEAMGISSATLNFAGGVASAAIGGFGVKVKRLGIDLTGRDALPVAQGVSGVFDATAGIDKAIINKGVTDKEADEAQLETDYSIDTSQAQHASSAFESDLTTIKQIIRDTSDSMKDSEQAKRQEFNV